MEAPNDPSTILEPEEEALRVMARSFWDVVLPYSSAPTSSQEKSREITSTENSQKTIKSSNVNFIAAVFFLSVLVGYMLVRKS